MNINSYKEKEKRKKQGGFEGGIMEKNHCTEICKVCGIPGCIEMRGRDFHAGARFGSKKYDYSGVPPFATAEWANDPDHLCLWCAGTGHPCGDESYGMCECPGLES
jgi:hypothetical protein